MKLIHLSVYLASCAPLLVSCSDGDASSPTAEDTNATTGGTAMESSGGSQSSSGGSEGGPELPATGETESGGGASGGETASGGSLTATGGQPEPSGAGLGEACTESEDCATGTCQDGLCLTTAPGCEVADVEKSPGNNWSDSYSVDGKCYCATTFDHNIGDILVETPVGERTVQEICNAVGPGPGIEGNPVYNDVQCGNGPANDALDGQHDR